MHRQLILVLAILVFVLTCALAYVILRGPSHPAPISIDAADENATEPLHQEMNCIDRVLQNHDMGANEVEPALARCQGGPSGNQGNRQ